jgi:hypothetical protein
MNQSKLWLKEAEFYISNSCNFNCTGCNRFNNYNFSGIELWPEYAEEYRRWAEILDIEAWSILGGEPMMNPTYLDWLENVALLWPNSQGRLTTNAYFLRADNRRLYDIIHTFKDRLYLDIGLHNIDRSEQVLATVKQWLVGEVVVRRVPNNLRDLPGFDQNWLRSYQAIRDPSWPDCNTIDEWETLPEHVRKECHEVFNLSPEYLTETRKGWELVDSNGVKVVIGPEDYFHQGAIKHINEHMTFHDSDPVKSHEICHMQKCHHFMHGKLYKCGVSALLPKFDSQFAMTLTESDRQLINSYQPADSGQDWATLKAFVTNLDQAIPQCKFCPENYNIKQIFAEHGKKIKIVRKT